MKFVVKAYDGKDEGALDRRMAVRGEHLEGIGKLCEGGHVTCAGGLINEQGVLSGSMLVMDFETRAELDAYLETEPYVVHDVWEEVVVDVCNLVIMDNQKVS